MAAALANPAREQVELVATENAARRMGLEDAVIETAKALSHRLPPSAVHQGVALRTDPLPTSSLEEMLATALPRIAVLDQIADPHNLGAIFRSAAAFGVGALIMQTRHTPEITGIVAKSAAGAIEIVREVRVVNIARTLEALGRAGYRIVGLAGETQRTLGDAVSGEAKLALVLGAEGAGLRPAVARACDVLARIPISDAMESLNVSNAAAIAFYEAMRSA